MVLGTGILLKGLVALGVVGVGAAAGIMFSGEIKEEMKSVGRVIWRTLDQRVTENLGIDNGECKWDWEHSFYKHCTLNNKDLNGIMFSDKAGNRVVAKTQSSSANLIIEKLPEEWSVKYPERLRITLTNADSEHSIVIGEGDNKIELKRSQYTFRIKKHSENEWSLERAYDLKTFGELVGLVCEEGEDVEECSFSSGKVNIWDEDDFVIEGIVEGEDKKIKVSRNNNDSREGFEFTVESEINLAEGAHNANTHTQLLIQKLFPKTVRKTTYRIDTKRIWGEDFWFLVEGVEENNNKYLNRKLRLAGIQDHNCHLGGDTGNGVLATKTCNLNKEKLGDVDIYKRDNTKEIVNLGDGKTVELTIKKLDEEENKGFSHGLGFQFTNRNDAEVKIPRNRGSSNRQDITLKRNVTYDFLIRESDIDIQLEPSDLTRTGKILGMKCSENGSKNECLTGEEINVWKDGGDYRLNAKIPANKKINVEKDTANYRRGFKYTPAADITLTDGRKSKDDAVEKLSRSATYEMDLKETTEGRKWFLVEKPSGT